MHTRDGTTYRLLSALLLTLVMLAGACTAGGEEAGTSDTPSAAGTEAGGEAAVADGGGGDCSMFEGQTLTLVVPFSPGGGYDTYARMIAPYLAEHLGAEVIVENQDGAGGLLAINSLVAAEPDGTRLAIMNAVGAGGGAIAGAEGVQFEIDELSYIGRVGASYHIFATAADSDYETIDDVLASDGFRYGSTGPGAADFVNGNLLNEIFDLNAEIVTGFEGSEENELAVTRGDVDGMTGDFDSRLPAITNGDHRALLLIGPERDEQIPDTPALLELDLTDEQRLLATAQIDLLDFGRPIVGPPGIPEDRLACLRDGLDRAVHDEGLVAESEEIGRPISWMTGEEVDELVQRLTEAPPEFQEVLAEAYSSG